MNDPSEVNLVLDLGTSVGKYLYQLLNGRIKHLIMSSESIKLNGVPNNSCNSFGSPEDNAWVRLAENGSIYAVGRLAKEYRATPSIKKLKYSVMVPKILAAVGAIATKEKLKERLNLDLAVLLPFSEYSNRHDLEKSLKSALKSFWFTEQRYQVNLREYRCYPEGFGIALENLRLIGLDKFQSTSFVILMFGYRNTSMLLFRNGSFSNAESSTTQLGFYDLIDKVTSKVSGISREEVQDAIVTVTEKYIDYEKANRSKRVVTKIALDDLIKSTTDEAKKAEREALNQALSQGLKDYWELIDNWLHEVLPPRRQLDGLFYCGGGAVFLETQLREYFQGSNLKVSSTSWCEQDLMSALALDEHKLASFREQNLALRFADVWGLFVNFAGYEVVKKVA